MPESAGQLDHTTAANIVMLEPRYPYLLVATMPDDDFYYLVKLSDAALDSILMAAAEAYYLGTPYTRRAKVEPYVEVDGYLWGYRSHRPEVDYTYIHVERFAPSLSSSKASGSVTSALGAAALMHAVMQRRAPQMAFLGKLHTHPYESVTEVQDEKGWNFSSQDRQWWPEIENDRMDLLPLYGTDAPLWLVVAVAPLKKVNFSSGANSIDDRLNIWRIDIGELRFWLHAEMGYPDDHGIAQFDQPVVLDMFPPFYNVPGDRLRPST